jgi:predicted secreted protein
MTAVPTARPRAPTRPDAPGRIRARAGVPGGAGTARGGAGVVAVALAAFVLAGCESPNLGDRPSTMAPPMLGAPASSVGPGPDGVPSVDLRGYRIATRVGDLFEIRLPGFPDSGYRWSLVDPVPAIVRGESVARGEAGPGDLAGAPAQEVWRFAGAAAGTGTLHFEFRRPGEPPATPPAQRATYRIEVR